MNGLNLLPKTVIIYGMTWDLIEGEEPYIDHENQRIVYHARGTNAHRMSELLGQIMGIMLTRSGVVTGQTKKPAVDQIVGALKNGMYYFLRDNQLDWAILTARVPSIVDMRNQRESVEIKELYDEEPVMIHKENTGKRIDDIAESFNKLNEYDIEGDNSNDSN